VARIEFRNLGRIKSGSIEPAALTLFVGKNNTGKSYAATLLWTLTQLSPRWMSDHAEAYRPDWWNDFVKLAEQKQAADIEVTHDMRQQLVAAVNLMLRERIGAQLKRAFAFDGFPKTEVTIVPSDDFVPFIVLMNSTEVSEGGQDKSSSSITTTGAIFDNEKNGILSVRLRTVSRAQDGIRRLGDRLFAQVAFRAAFGPAWDELRRSMYIPAARTGLILAFRSLLAQSLDDENATPVPLPEPIRDFLRRLTFVGYVPPRSKMKNLASWIGANLIDGDVIASDDEVPQFSFRSKRMDAPLPLHATSSMITEVAPFLLAVKQGLANGLLIFEEPEAHLHLSAQREMARAIARLLNTGSRIVVTTHSDTFFQQLNNLMIAHAMPVRSTLVKSLGYSKGDLIDPKMVAVYEFIDHEDETTIRKLDIRDGAFAVSSLNETLVDLAKETIALTRASDD